MNPVLYVGLGGALGAAARFLIGTRIATPGRATLAVNVLGCFILGLVTGAQVTDSLLLFAGTGFCGALTTFSSFAVETTDEYTTAGSRPALWLAALHLVGGISAVIVGALLGTVLN